MESSPATKVGQPFLQRPDACDTGCRSQEASAYGPNHRSYIDFLESKAVNDTPTPTRL